MQLSELWGSKEIGEGQPQPSEISPSAVVKSTQIQSCRIDDGAFVDEKTSLKQSYIGSSTTIETKTRISDSVIMGNVTIRQRYTVNHGSEAISDSQIDRAALYRRSIFICISTRYNLTDTLSDRDLPHSASQVRHHELHIVQRLRNRGRNRAQGLPGRSSAHCRRGQSSHARGSHRRRQTYGDLS